MSTRDSFVQHFGEDNAAAVEGAAQEHENGMNSNDKGSDPFRWAISIAIGYQCMELDRYREHHGFTAPWPAVKQWIKDHGDLAHHDGDVDYLALLAGTYNEYMPAAEAKADA